MQPALGTYLLCTAESCLPCQVFPTTTYLDDMMLAAAWMAMAAGSSGYLADATAYFTRIQADPTLYRTINYDWDNQYWAACLLMWQLTGESGYASEVSFSSTESMGSGCLAARAV